MIQSTAGGGDDEAESSSEKHFDNQQTWPCRPRNLRGGLTELHDWIRLQRILNQAKSFVRYNGEAQSGFGVGIESSTGPGALQSTLEDSNDYGSDQAHSADGQNLQTAARLVDALTRELERRAAVTRAGGVGDFAAVALPSISSNRLAIFRKRHESVGGEATTRRTRLSSLSVAGSAASMNVIREDPHFESMIICDSIKEPIKSYGSMESVKTSASRLDRSHITTSQNQLADCVNCDRDDEVFSNEPTELVDVQIPGETFKDPALLRAVPHLLIFIIAVLYLLGGVYAFSALDATIAAKPFRVVLLFAFQTCTSIGWGDTAPANRWSQLFCVFYTVFGVPIIFSAFANVGRLMTEFYCIDWLFLTAVVRERVKVYTEKYLPNLSEVRDNFQPIEVRQRFPIRATINFLFIHQCIGVVLYGGLFKQLDVIKVIYFSITSMATTGYGDIHPDPATTGEAVVVIVYISGGIIIFSALLLSIGYHFQRIVYVIVPNLLHYYCYGAQKLRRRAGPNFRSRRCEMDWSRTRARIP